MKVIEKGHIYQLAVRGTTVQEAEEPETLTFICLQPNMDPHPGTTTQEVLRVLIDRTKYCNNCQPHPVNERIVYHLRMALILHEARALERGFEKGETVAPEFWRVGSNGHLPHPEVVFPDGEYTQQLHKAPLDGAKTREE